MARKIKANYIKVKGPNPLYNGIVPNATVSGTELGTIFDIPCEVQKGSTTTTEHVVMYATPDTFDNSGNLISNGRTYIQVNNGAGPQLIEVDSFRYETVDVHNVVDTTSGFASQVVQKEIVVVHGADGNDYPLPVDITRNAEAIKAITEITRTPSCSPARALLADLERQATQITPSELPRMDRTILQAGLATNNPAIQQLSAKSKSMTYSRIYSNDPPHPRDARVDRFSAARYPDRDTVPEIGVEFYLDFTHTRKPSGVPPRDVKDKIAVTLDHRGQTYVTLKNDADIEQNYALEGVGTAKPPVKDGEEEYTQDEVIYLDIINQNGQKQRIYLPAEVSKNKEFLQNLQDIIDDKVQLYNFDEVATIPRFKELSDTLMNETFRRDRIPDGPLSYTDGDVTHLYLPHDNDYLRLMTKAGKNGLFINLDNVVQTPPSTLFPDGTTFEVQAFQYNSATPQMLQAVVSDGTQLRIVDLPMTRTEVEASDLCDQSNTPPTLRTPQQIANDITYTAVDEHTYPPCKDKRATGSTIRPDLTHSNFHYDQRDNAGNLQHSYHYIHYMNGANDEHIQVIAKNGNLYANLNTNPSDPDQSETCLIESIIPGANPGDPASITYIAGNPGVKYTGTLPIINDGSPENQAAILDLMELCAGNAPIRPSEEIYASEIPAVTHAPLSAKSVVTEIGRDVNPKTVGTVGTALVQEKQKDSAGNDLSVYTQEIGFNGSNPNPFSSGNNQQLGTFIDNNTLLTVTSKDPSITTQPLALVQAGTPQIMLLSEEQVNALAAANPSIDLTTGATIVTTPDGRRYLQYEIEATQLGQNISLNDVRIQTAGGAVNLNIGSQGIIARRGIAPNIQTAIVRQSDYPLDIAVSKAFVEEALNNVGKPAATTSGCRFEGVDGSGNITLPQDPLASIIYASLTKQHRQECISKGINPIPPLSLGTAPNDVELWSLPTGEKDGAGNDIYADFRVGPERDASGNPKVYYYGHTTTEHNMETETGGKGKAKYIQLTSSFFAEQSSTHAPHLILESHLVGENKRDVALPMAAFDSPEGQRILSFLAARTLYDNTSTTSDVRTIGTFSGTHIYSLDPSAKATYIDDNVAQVKRGDATSILHPAVDPIADPTQGRLQNVDPIATPPNPITPTNDEIEKKEAEKKEGRKLWDGLSDENRKFAFGAMALATAFSVFIPFLGIIAGILLAVIAASDTKIFDDLYLPAFMYKNKLRGLNPFSRDRRLQRHMFRNQSRIRTYNDYIKDIDAKIEKIQANSKLSQAAKNAKIAKLTAERNQFVSMRDNLVAQTKQDAVRLAVAADKQLNNLKCEKKWLEKVDRRAAELRTRFGLSDTIDTTYAGRQAELGRLNSALGWHRGHRHRLGPTQRRILEQQKLFTLAEMDHDHRNGVAGATALTAQERKQRDKLAKKYDFDQGQFDYMKELVSAKARGDALTDEQLQELEKLRKKYGRSPFAAIADAIAETTASVDRREEEVAAMGERYVEEHPENGFVEWRFEEATNAPLNKNEARNADNPREAHDPKKTTKASGRGRGL